MSYKKNTQVEVLPVVDLCKNRRNNIFFVDGATQVGSIVDMSRRLLPLAYMPVRRELVYTHYILALLCRFYAPK